MKKMRVYFFNQSAINFLKETIIYRRMVPYIEGSSQVFDFGFFLQMFEEHYEINNS